MNMHGRVQIKSNCISAYITSLETLKTLFFFLVHNPAVAANIQREIDHNIGQRQPGLADRENLPYTEAAVLETLRLSSFVPLGAVHVATGEFTVNGMQIPKGSVVSDIFVFFLCSCMQKYCYKKNISLHEAPVPGAEDFGALQCLTVSLS